MSDSKAPVGVIHHFDLFVRKPRANGVGSTNSIIRS